MIKSEWEEEGRDRSRGNRDRWTASSYQDTRLKILRQTKILLSLSAVKNFPATTFEQNVYRVFLLGRQ